MPQGKFKKAKAPANIKKLNKKKEKHGTAFTRRPNAPIQPKKNKFTVQDKLKNVVTKSVNKAAEDELRGRATESTINLSNAQKVIAQHNKNAASKAKVETSDK